MSTSYFKSGEHYVWLTGGAIAVALTMVVGLLLLVAVNGMTNFWPHKIWQQTLTRNGEQSIVLGEIVQQETSKIEGQMVAQTLFRIGNRDVYGQDFRWYHDADFNERTLPRDAVMVERTEWGNMYGFLDSVQENEVVHANSNAVSAFERAMSRVNTLRGEAHAIEQGEMSDVNQQLDHLRLRKRKLELDGKLTDAIAADMAQESAQLNEQFNTQQQALAAVHHQLARDSVTIKLIDGQTKTIPLAKIEHIYFPNQLTFAQRVSYFFTRVGEFLSQNPRESNTEGGVFPAIFGTVTMVLLMSLIVTPFGVIAAVYLSEYAKQNWFTRTIRIAVNNLAGVPSIVYGVFGLGFFVYTLGSGIDNQFFAEAKPAPTFGTPGLLWASLTLALLTLPVVIVSTEEGLSRIPKAIREGSLALGATKIETLWRTVLPMASPAMMTGLILAVARAAGEVAPLMLVGVVKLSPELPMDLSAPFLHLERKFMHLGFHIYDVGFQSPNIEAARPLVYASALLLVLVTVLLNISAIKIRNHLREKYKSLEH